LAAEEKAAVMIDEKKGRRTARLLGLKTIGTLGAIILLLKEKSIGKTEAVKAVEKLLQNILRPLSDNIKELKRVTEKLQK